MSLDTSRVECSLRSRAWWRRFDERRVIAHPCMGELCWALHVEIASDRIDFGKARLRFSFCFVRSFLRSITGRYLWNVFFNISLWNCGYNEIREVDFWWSSMLMSFSGSERTVSKYKDRVKTKNTSSVEIYFWQFSDYSLTSNIYTRKYSSCYIC